MFFPYTSLINGITWNMKLRYCHWIEMDGHGRFIGWLAAEQTGD